MICIECNRNELIGRQKSYCSKLCANKYASRKWYINNKDKSREANKKWRSNSINWENEKSKARERNKSEKSLAYWRSYSKTFRSKTLHGRVVSLNAHVHYRKQSNLNVDWHDILNKLGDLDQWKCNYCAATKNLTFDHIVPFHHNGKHTIDNIQILCRSCNSTKGCHERWKLKHLTN